MSPSRPKPAILVVERDPDVRAIIERTLGARYDIQVAGGTHRALEFLSRADREFTAVIAGEQVPKSSTFEFFDKCAKSAPGALHILVSEGQLSEIPYEDRGSLYSFINKPLDPEVVRLTVDRAAEHHVLQQQARALERAPKREGKKRPPGKTSGLVGNSTEIAAVRALIDVVGSARGAVLITGESGTGKEVVARALHLAGRANKSFIGVNCAALPRELIESELFGYERGTFTGATGSREGLMRAAGDGTLFLDEVTEMPLELQPKLLRALEERAIRPIGGHKELPFRARVISSTNRNPAEAVETGLLRADVFYRLCVFRIDLPPLRNHPEDIPILIRELEGALDLPYPVTVDSDALTILRRYPWPGNVRELRNVIEHAATMSRTGHIEVQHLPSHITASRAAPPSSVSSEAPRTLAEMERAMVYQALETHSGNKAAAARQLGISRHQIYTLIEKLERS